MRITRVGAGILVLALGAGQRASAASDDFPATIFCNSGQALKTCAAFMIMTGDDGNGGTSVMLFIRNLAGTAPDNTVKSFISKIGLAGIGPGTVSGLSVTTFGAVNLVGSPGTKWSSTGSAPELGSLTFEFETGAPAKNGAIQGCTISSNPADYFQTCDTAGFTGWVKFNFTTSNRWFASEAFPAYKVQGAGTEGLSLECITNPEDPKFNCSVVPEPASMLLLATGLVGLGGLGGLGFRRRGSKRG